MRPLAKGVVEKISVSLGSRVTAGQPLLMYDNIELGQLVGDFLTEQSALRQTQTDREVKRTGLARAEALIKIEAIRNRNSTSGVPSFATRRPLSRAPKRACRESRSNSIASG